MITEIFPFSYNSCRNGHCPQCQGHKREEWIQKREQDLLPCSYYHVVFTLPEELNALEFALPKVIYKILFEATWATLNQFGKTQGLQLGMIAVLHTLAPLEIKLAFNLVFKYRFPIPLFKYFSLEIASSLWKDPS